MITEVHVSEIFKAIKLIRKRKKAFRFMHMRIKCEPLPLMAANDKLLGKLCNELNPPLRGVVKLLLASQGRFLFLWGGGGGGG